MEEAEQMAAEEPVQVTKEEADRMAKDLADMASKVLTFARGGRAEAMEQARVEEAERIEVLGKGEEEEEEEEGKKMRKMKSLSMREWTEARLRRVVAAMMAEEGKGKEEDMRTPHHKLLD